MRILIDTDVLLDVALKREPFVRSSREVLSWAQDQPGQAAVAWHSLSSAAVCCGAGLRCDVYRDAEYQGL